MAGKIEVFQQGLTGWDLVGFFVDLHMSEHQGRVGREGAEDLPGLAVMKRVEAALQYLPVERQNPCHSCRRPDSVEFGRVTTERLFNMRGIKPGQDRADRCVRRRPLPL